MSVLLSCVFIATTAPFANAAESGSSNFQAKNAELGTIGGTSTSTGFQSTMSGDLIPHGPSASTNFILNAGPMYFESFTPRSQNWQWFGDEASETPSSSLAGENVTPSDITALDIIKLRVTVAEKQNIGEEQVKFRLQFATTSDFSSYVHFVDEVGTCSSESVWCYADGGGADNGIITTALLSDADACVASVGDGCGTHNEAGTTTSSFTHAASTTVEYEFTIQESGTTANTVYYFRLVDVQASSSVPVMDSHSYPSVLTEGATLAFTIEGISTSASTEGVTTDVGTTPTTVPFGQVPFSVETEAAQRLKVTTNAGQGYRIFAFQRQGLLNGGGEISPVDATNASPDAWSSACAPAANSCYGYHTGEDVLLGGSTRFAPDDSYAQFSSSPEEIAFSAIPANDRTTDIVYKIEARTGSDTGTFESSIVYIVVPVF